MPNMALIMAPCWVPIMDPTSLFVPEGISSSMRDFIFLVFKFEDFNILFFLWNKVPYKKNYVDNPLISSLIYF